MESTRRRMRRILFLAGLVLVALGGTLWTTVLASPDPPPVPAKPKKLIHALGRLEPEGEIISVAAPSSAGDARIESLAVSEDDTVRAGDTLAILDSESRLREAVNVAEMNAVRAKAALALTRREIANQREQLASALRTAESDLTQADKNAARYKQLASISAVSSELYEDARLKCANAAEAVIKARANLDRHGSGSLDDSPDVLVAWHEFEAAEAVVKQAAANLADARVLAPSDGTVLRIRARPGERAGTEPILEMGNTNQMMARVEVYESEVSGLSPGQKATLTASPLPHSLGGEIVRISSLIRKQEIIEANPAANTDARVMEVWLKLDAPSSQVASRFVNLQVRVAFAL